MWQVAEARNRFSELVTRALTAGPQRVWRRGETRGRFRMILLDTNVVSKARHPLGSEKTRAEMRERKDYLCLSVLGEIPVGIRNPDAGKRRAALEAAYGEIRRECADRLLEVSRDVAEAWGETRARRRRMARPLAATDGLIATTLAHDLTLWTRNKADLDGTGTRLFNSREV